MQTMSALGQKRTCPLQLGLSAMGQNRTLAETKRKDRLAAVFRSVLVMTRSIASRHWQTDALFFELFPYPLNPLVIREGDRAGIPKALELTRRIVDVSFHEFF